MWCGWTGRAPAPPPGGSCSGLPSGTSRPSPTCWGSEDAGESALARRQRISTVKLAAQKVERVGETVKMRLAYGNGPLQHLPL